MINEIMDAVTNRLDELFPDCRIYTDAVEQGLETPCFFVSVLEPAERQMIGQRYFREAGFVIQYLPDEAETDSINRNINQVLEALFDGMEYITLADGKIMNGTKRNSKVEEEILHFFVSYNCFVIKKASFKEAMDFMETDISLKGD